MATIYKYPAGNYEFRDDDDQFTTEQVQQQLTQYFPELANATTDEKELENGTREVTFVKRAGTKG
jgi:PRTRC genetic system protein C